MANKYNDALAVLLNNGQKQVLPVSKAQLIELANADKTKFTGYDVTNAVSVADALTYLLNKGNQEVASALNSATAYTAAKIEALAGFAKADTGYVLSYVVEESGVISKQEQVWLDASVVSYQGGEGGPTTVQGAITNIQETLAGLAGEGEGSVAEQIANAIDTFEDGLSYSEAAAPNMPVVAVTETDGVIAPVQGNIDAQYVNVDNSSLHWDLDNDDVDDTNITVQSAISYLDSQINALETSAARYTLTEVTGNDVPETVLHRYQLSQSINGGSATKAGEYIDIPKDSSLKEVYLGLSTDTVNATTGVVTKGAAQGDDVQSLNFVYHLEDGTYSLVPIDVSKFLTESEFGDGLEVTNGVVSAKVTDADGFLTLDSTTGITLSGVQTAITTAENNAKAYADGLIEGLDSEILAKTENNFSYVMTGVTEADGVLTNATYIGLSDVTVKTTTFDSESNLYKLLGSTDIQNVTDVHSALNAIAGQVKSAQGEGITNIIGDTDNSYITITGSKTGNTYTLVLDDSKINNVATLSYTVLSDNAELVTILGANPEV